MRLPQRPEHLETLEGLHWRERDILVVNAAAGTSPSPQAIARIANQLDVQSVYVVPRDASSLAAELQGLRSSAPPRSITVIGGDGTLRHVLGLLTVLPNGRMPAIRLLDGGTLGLVATVLRAEHAWHRVENDAPADWQAHTVPWIRVNGRAGFTASIGAFSALAHDFQSFSAPRTAVPAYIADAIVASVKNDAWIRNLTAPVAADVWADDIMVSQRNCAGIFISGLPQVARAWDARSAGRGAVLHSLVLPHFRSNPALFAAGLVLGRLFTGTSAYANTSQSLRIEPSAPLRVTLDGDSFTTSEAIEVELGGYVAIPPPIFRDIARPARETSRKSNSDALGGRLDAPELHHPAMALRAS